ncbi:hypothetical protein AWN90_34945 [Nocardia terpenica]|uniref:Uncharacterized protein n=1 Tax=Nocardia terpenica TaxID=455432 RepID=A0A164MXX4_9NOCA|nr:hypothetical protein AWN90_34945 [Nocardia terpenica]
MRNDSGLTTGLRGLHRRILRLCGGTLRRYPLSLHTLCLRGSDRPLRSSILRLYGGTLCRNTLRGYALRLCRLDLSGRGRSILRGSALGLPSGRSLRGGTLRLCGRALSRDALGLPSGRSLRGGTLRLCRPRNPVVSPLSFRKPSTLRPPSGADAPSGAIIRRAGSLAGIMPRSRARVASSGAESAVATSRCSAARSSSSWRLILRASPSW